LPTFEGMDEASRLDACGDDCDLEQRFILELVLRDIVMGMAEEVGAGRERTLVWDPDRSRSSWKREAETGHEFEAAKKRACRGE